MQLLFLNLVALYMIKVFYCLNVLNLSQNFQIIKLQLIIYFRKMVVVL